MDGGESKTGELSDFFGGLNIDPVQASQQQQMDLVTNNGYPPSQQQQQQYPPQGYNNLMMPPQDVYSQQQQQQQQQPYYSTPQGYTFPGYPPTPMHSTPIPQQQNVSKRPSKRPVFNAKQQQQQPPKQPQKVDEMQLARKINEGAYRDAYSQRMKMFVFWMSTDIPGLNYSSITTGICAVGMLIVAILLTLGLYNVIPMEETGRFQFTLWLFVFCAILLVAMLLSPYLYNDVYHHTSPFHQVGIYSPTVALGLGLAMLFVMFTIVNTNYTDVRRMDSIRFIHKDVSVDVSVDATSASSDPDSDSSHHHSRHGRNVARNLVYFDPSTDELVIDDPTSATFDAITSDDSSSSSSSSGNHWTELSSVETSLAASLVFDIDNNDNMHLAKKVRAVVANATVFVFGICVCLIVIVCCFFALACHLYPEISLDAPAFLQIHNVTYNGGDGPNFRNVKKVTKTATNNDDDEDNE